MFQLLRKYKPHKYYIAQNKFSGGCNIFRKFSNNKQKEGKRKRSARGKSWEEKINLCNLFIKTYALFHRGPL